MSAAGAVALTAALTACEVRPPAPPWRIDMASVNAAGTDGGSPAGTFDHTEFFSPVFSPDGTKVLFTSPANDLGPRDTHSHPQPQFFGDVYMRDLVAGTTTLISVNAAGTDSGDQPSEEPRWAGNDKVVFYSFADDLVPHDTNQTWDIFVRDLTTSTTTLVSANVAGTDSGRNLTLAFFAVSPDGTRVAFSSLSPDLVPVDTNRTIDVFERNLVTGTTTLVSVDAAGTDSAPASADQPAYSPDGTRIAFVAQGGGFGPPDANGAGDVYLRDVVHGTTTMASVNAAGTDGGNDLSDQAQFSPDGRLLLFESFASNLGPTDTNGDSDLYLRDLARGTTSLVTVNASGTDSASSPRFEATNPIVSFSPDGRRIAFNSLDTNLVPVDTNGHDDVFVHDIAARTNRLLSTNAAGTDSADGDSFDPRFNPNGTSLAFGSRATDLGPPGAAEPEFPFADVFVRSLGNGKTTLVTPSTNGPDQLDSFGARFSTDGRRLVFISQSNSLGPPDDGSGWDVYVATSRGADLFATLRAEPAGAKVRYRARFGNGGPERAKPVTAVVILPEGGHITAVATTAGRCRRVETGGPPVALCGLGRLGAGRHVDVTVTAAGPAVPAVAALSSPTEDPDRSDNTAAVAVRAG